SLGAEFTSDPQLPWASEILQRTREQPEETRRQRLYRRAVAFMDEVPRETNCNAILARQRMLPNEPSLTPRAPGNVEDRVGHDPEPNWASVESVDEDGAKLDWNDQVMAWGDDRCDGSFTWSIPWEFRVRDGPAKVFAIVEQTATVTRAGRASAEKAGAQVSSDLNDRSVEDPIFE